MVVSGEGTGLARQKENAAKVTSCPGLPGPVLGSPLMPGNRDSESPKTRHPGGLFVVGLENVGHRVERH